MLVRKVFSAFKNVPPASRLNAVAHVHKIAAVAIILRENNEKKCTEMLFIKRSMNERDVWSGDIAFPGGCHDSGDGACGFDTVCREVQEETGIDLKNGKRYIHVGTMSERTVPRGRKHLTILPFVFVDNAPFAGNEYKIDGKEISCLWWENVDIIDDNFNGLRDSYTIDIEKRFIGRFLRKPMYYYGIKSFIKMLSISSCSFPCIRLSPSYSTCELFLPAGASNDAELRGTSTNFALWGLTMSMFTELILIASQKKNPYLTTHIKFHNPVFNVHFHFWQKMNASWRNSLTLGAISYCSTCAALLYGLYRFVNAYI